MAAIFVASLGAAVVSSARVSAKAFPFQDIKPEAGAAAPGAGSSVLAGVYTEEQAKRGEEVAGKLCVGCHGPDLTGGEAGPSLVGLEFIGNWTSLTLADFYDRINSTMPADAPGTLTPQQTSDVATYVLKLNKFPAGTTELPSDMAALKGIKIEGPH
jgi:mono/diheme cytochrome c family protein